MSGEYVPPGGVPETAPEPMPEAWEPPEGGDRPPGWGLAQFGILTALGYLGDLVVWESCTSRACGVSTATLDLTEALFAIGLLLALVGAVVYRNWSVGGSHRKNDF